MGWRAANLLIFTVVIFWQGLSWLSEPPNFNHMLKNFFKVAIRNLKRDSVHSFINIAGLSVGMSVAIIIGLWIWDEWSVDRYNTHYDQIARVMQNVHVNGEVYTGGGTPFPLAEALRSKYSSDLTQVVKGLTARPHVLAFGEKMLKQSGAYFESGAPDLLDLTMLRGTRAALADPDAILLSASVARAYFGDADPINKTMTIDAAHTVRVTGVYKDLPANSSFADMGYIGAWQQVYDNWGLKDHQHPWRMNAFITLVRLAPHADLNTVSAKIKDVKARNVQGSDALAKPALFLQPMNKWHLFSDYKNGVEAGGKIKYIRLYGMIGIFVLLLACINFMNLSTARSEKRAREVGIRKAIGSLRGQLILQFFSESLLVALLAFAGSLLIVQLSLPFFNEIADKKMLVPWGNFAFWSAGLLFTILTGFIAGSYPALYLSSFRPVKVLKGVFKTGPAAAIPRRVLTVLQFTVSVVLIVATIVVFQQIRYAQNRPIGFDQNNLVMVPMQSDDFHDHWEAAKSALVGKGAVTEMAEAESFASDYGVGSGDFEWPGKDPALSDAFPATAISYDYGKTIGWQLAGGRDFSRAYARDSAAFIVNEAAVKYMGLKNPIGVTMKWFGRPYTIVGVVKDIIVESPYEEVRPLFFYLYDYSHKNVILRLNPGASASASLKQIAATFRKYAPAQPFEYYFADSEYGKKFADEQRIGKLAGCFALLAIFISCLGLFGMASFVAERRTQEIGVRKVLGATVGNIWRLLSTEFVRLVLLSLLISIPASWYAMHQWLQNYHFRAPLSWWIFAVVGLAALAITLLTVSYQAIKAALANPVRSLRSDG
jgi:putative ABC transport system permease protein